MLIIKIFTLVSLLFSDLMIIFASLKYATSGDPKYHEAAKQQLLFGFLVNILSIIGLTIIHLYQGINLELYTKLEWFFFSLSLTSLIIFLLSIIFYKIHNRFFYKKINEDIHLNLFLKFLNLGFFSFLFFELSIQVFLIFIIF